MQDNTELGSLSLISTLQMNLMVLSDYGMTADNELEPIFIDEYLNMTKIQYVILSSGYAAIVPYALTYQNASSTCE